MLLILQHIFMKTDTLEIPFLEYNSVKKKATRTNPKLHPTAQKILPKPTPPLVEVSKEEALLKTTAYFKGDALAAQVWLSKYALKDANGKLYESSPDAMHKRLSNELGRIEQKYPNPLPASEIYGLLKDFRYLVPQGGPMTGIGNDFQIASLSNCFVIGLNGATDSYGAVMKIDEEQVQLMKRRGGVGHDLSGIRPSGTSVMNSALSATGIVPFMERYSNSTREVAQGGRRGALMLSLAVNHPDVLNFIDAKQDTSKVTGANVSVRITDDFMHAVTQDGPVELKFPVDAAQPQISKTVKAQTIWKKIVHNAWQSAEPGILFWDTILKESVPDAYAQEGFQTVSTNPCGEIPLCPYDSCRLLAINLFSYVDQPFTPQAKFDFEKFKIHVQKAQRLMDDIVDLELEKIERILQKIDSDPEPFDVKRTERNLWLKIKEKCVQGRRMGLGITAEGDMLAALNIQYGSEASIEHTVKVHKTMALQAYRGSVELAKERGAFPIFNWKKEKHNLFIKRLASEDPTLFEDMKAHGRRNIALLTIAPTGTTSIMTQTTSGLEPVFKVAYKRRRKVNPEEQNSQVAFVDDLGDAWEEFHVFHHHFCTWLEANGHDVEKVKKMDDAALSALIAQSPYHQSTANDVDWVMKVKMQGAIQKWVDHSISVTVNLPNDVPESLIGAIYIAAWESGCKGITVYRDGSRTGVLVGEDKTSKEAIAYKRPEKLQAKILRFNNNHEKWIAVIGEMNGHPYEIFTGKAEDAFSLPNYVQKGAVIKRKIKGQSRYDLQYQDKEGYEITIGGLSRAFEEEFWNYAKLISGILRHDMPIDKVVHVVSQLQLNDDSLNTWKNGVVRALSKYIPDGTKPRNNECPECKEPALVFEEGCLNCKHCGHTKCGG